MNRRAFIARAGLGAGMLGAGVLGGCFAPFAGNSGASPGAARKKKPNLVFIFADQLRPMAINCFGGDVASTPRMDRMAAEGANFVNCISTTPVCAPYRATMLTGRYGHANGVIANQIRLPEDEITFGEIFKAAGYRTGYVGKWHLTGRHDHQYEPPGPGRHGFDFWRAFAFNHQHNRSVYYGDSPEPLTPEAYQMDWETDRAVDFIQRGAEDDRPFCLFMSWGPPHPPYTPWNMPKKYLERYGEVKEVAFEDLPENRRAAWQPWQQPVEFTPRPLPERGNVPEKHALDDLSVATYYAMTDWCDDCLGRVLDAVRDAGLDEDTVVVFSSDHGEMLNSHGTRGKMIYYDESVRIPFFVRWPGIVPPGGKPDACISNVDFLPTLLGLLGLEHPKPERLQGMDLSHCALGRSGPEPRGAIIASYVGYAGFGRGWEYRAVRTKRWTYARSQVELKRWYGTWGADAEYDRKPEIHLFDNANDPLQQNDLADDSEYAAVRQTCEDLIKAYMERTGDRFLTGLEYREWYDDDWNLVRS